MGAYPTGGLCPHHCHDHFPDTEWPAGRRSFTSTATRQSIWMSVFSGPPVTSNLST